MQDKKTKKKQKAKEGTTLTIDIGSLLTPIAILLGAVIIAIGIFVSINRSGTNSIGKDSATNTIGTDSGASGDAPQVDSPKAVTNIDDDPILGNRDTAKIAIVEFSDYECPFCKRYQEQTRDEIVSKYVDSGDAIMVYRDFPLSFHNPLATDEAMAAECVQDLAGNDKYFQYSKSIFNTTQSNGKGMERSKLFDLADNIGVDGKKIESCVDSGKFAEEINKDIEDGGNAGVTGTPGFVIGVLSDNGSVDGVNVSGAQPFSVFEQVIEEQLNRTN